MSGFVLKDFLVMQKNLRYYFFIMVVYGVLVVMGVFPYSIISGFILLVAMMTPMSTFAYDEQARWDKYAAATPAGRRGVVKGKYAFTLLLLGAVSLITLVVLELLWLTGKGGVENWVEPLLVVGSMDCISLLVGSAILPVLFKYGSEKSRVISMVIFVGVFGSMALLAYLVGKGADLSGIGAVLNSWDPALLLVVLILATLGALALYYRISLAIYAKREL